VTRSLAALLLLPALALAGCGGTAGANAKPHTAGATTAQGPADAQTATVVAGNNLKFTPETVRARVGTLALTMTIRGGVPHNLSFSDSAVGPALPTIPSGSRTQDFRFDKAGTYRFLCTIHPGMVGQVIVS
jgi:plastocyanin